MTPMRAGAAALLLTAATGLAVTGAMGTASAAKSKPAPAPAPAPVATVSPETFVNRAYEDILNHPGDAAGKAFWVQQINQGMTHARVAAGLTQTNDYRSLVVQQAYVQTMGRDADPTGLQYWIGYMARGGDVAQLTGALAGSGEYAAQFGTNYDAFVKATYKNLLGRNVDPAGEAYWVGRLSSGAPAWNVAASISHAYEWYSNRAAFDYVHFHVGYPDANSQAYWAHRLMTGTPEWYVVAELVGSDSYATWASTHP